MLLQLRLVREGEGALVLAPPDVFRTGCRCGLAGQFIWCRAYLLWIDVAGDSAMQCTNHAAACMHRSCVDREFES